ncbi:MAG: 19 kDa lipoprotein antigen [Mycobacterium sp.]|nr:19 kDa lipoprotein antigen [Mycobacterium sp.]
MKRGFMVAVGGAAVVVAGLAGCSSDKSSTSASSSASSSSASASVSVSASATAAPGGAKVSIDGQDQNIQGQVVCASMGGNVNIAIGESATGIAAVVAEGDSPVVHSVGLGNVNGVTLGFQENAGQGNAEATKDGSSYKISGNATGIDMANPLQPLTKPFEIQVSCP